LLFGRLHERALQEQSRFIFRYCRPFILSIFSNKASDDQPDKANDGGKRLFLSTASEDDIAMPVAAATQESPSDVLPVIGEYEGRSPEEEDGYLKESTEEPVLDDVVEEPVASTPSSPQVRENRTGSLDDKVTLFSLDDFSSRLGYLCRIIFLLSRKDSYDIFVTHAFRAIVAPILAAIHELHELVDAVDDVHNIGASASQLCSEVS
jgi:hypothetical protein